MHVEDGGRRIRRVEVLKVKKPKVINFPQELGNEIGIVTPMNINQAQSPADMLKSGRTILCNFNGTEKRSVEQIRFFLMGVVYAIGGTCKKVNETIWLFTPYHMGVVTEHPEVRVPVKEKKAEHSDEEVLDRMFGT